MAVRLAAATHIISLAWILQCAIIHYKSWNYLLSLIASTELYVDACKAQVQASLQHIKGTFPIISTRIHVQQQIT